MKGRLTLLGFVEGMLAGLARTKASEHNCELFEPVSEADVVGAEVPRGLARLFFVGNPGARGNSAKPAAVRNTGDASAAADVQSNAGRSIISRMRGRGAVWLLCVGAAMALSCGDGATGGGADANGNGNADAAVDAGSGDQVAPTAQASPDDDSAIAPSYPITILFSESMNTSSLVLGGSMAGDSPQITWGTTSASNDTLTLAAPPAGWTLPATLTIDAEDLAGNPLAQPRLDYRAMTDFPLITVRVHAVKVSNDDGSFACAITPAQVASWIEEANRVYAPAGIHFQFEASSTGPDWSEVQSTLINQMTGTGDPQWAAERDAANAEAATHANKLTILFRYGPSPGAPTGGGFSSTDYNFIAAPGFDVTQVCGHQNITLVAHETGHYLGLAHTFAGIYDTVALAESALSGASNDPSFFEGDHLVDTPPDPYVLAQQCTGPSTTDLNGIPFALPRNNIMSYYDSSEMTLSPLQILTVRQSALLRTGQSLTELLPGVDSLYEGEALVSGATVSGGVVGVQGDMSTFFGLWSQGSQLFWGNVAVDDVLTLSLSAPAGTYRIWAVFTQAPDFGVFSAEVNGFPSATFDLYGGRVIQGPPVDLGVHALDGTGDVLRLIATGANLRNTTGNIALGLDYILLEPLI